MPKVFYIQIDLLGQPGHSDLQALHDLMRAEGFCQKQHQLTGGHSLAETSYFGRSETNEGSLRSSLRSRIAERVWGYARVRVSALGA